ncbi:MAG: hypothetical protein E4H25_06445 [Methanomassiliicoccus sp.]|nr:MAG: hypothetical protein E4H25_06445 [Methanomassiliicoccus sp.]
MALIVPWYGADYDYFLGLDRDFREEYSAGLAVEYDYPGDPMGDLMTGVTVVLILSLVASVTATVLSYLGKRAPGIIAAIISAGLLLASAVMFYLGVIDELSLNDFEGYTMLNRSWSVITESMIGWWIALTGGIVSIVQAVVLALSQTRDHAKEETPVSIEGGQRD